MDMGYDDSNNVISKNLGIIDFEGRFLYKIRHAGPVCGVGGGSGSGGSVVSESSMQTWILWVRLPFAISSPSSSE